MIFNNELKIYLSKFIDLNSKSTFSLSTSNIFNLKTLFSYIENCNVIINLSKMNNIRYTNKFFEEVNCLIKNGSIYIGCIETKELRRVRFYKKKIIFKNLFYFFDVIFTRIFPRVFFLIKFYFFITRGRRKVISQAECLGRLVSCGFEIIDFKVIDSLMYFVVKKKKEPFYDMNASYGPLFKMKRLGENGKFFYCLKFRTMHPFSEYLHHYILQTQGYSKSGKPANDYRVTTWGKFLRKYWLDELPQLINVLKGEMKLVGVRPISERYSHDISEGLLKLRLSSKPGCIPPYVSLNMSSAKDDVLSSEVIYLNDRLRNPYFTDIKYFFYALFNIIVRRKRSA